MKKTFVVGFYLLAFGAAAALGQASSTASRSFDLQAGGGFSVAKSDYGNADYKGLALYTTLDFRPHFGVEFDFHQVKSPYDQEYEKTYEWGGRYHRSYGRFEPYIKGAYGRGVYNFVATCLDTSGKPTHCVVANLAFNEFAFGGGTDYRLLRWLNLRADYEFQMWRSFPANGLTPQVFTIGVAYHFPGGLARGRHF